MSTKRQERRKQETKAVEWQEDGANVRRATFSLPTYLRIVVVALDFDKRPYSVLRSFIARKRGHYLHSHRLPVVHKRELRRRRWVPLRYILPARQLCLT